MGTDPEPRNAVRYANAQRSVVQTNSGGPKVSHLLEVYAWMARIRFDELKGLIGQRLNCCWQ